MNLHTYKNKLYEKVCHRHRKEGMKTREKKMEGEYDWPLQAIRKSRSTIQIKN